MTTLAIAPAICTTVTSRLEETANGENPFAGTPAVYTTPDHVRWTHSLSNSLGHREANNATDVTVLLDGSEEQQVEYIQGILIAAIIIFLFFTLWILILFIFKCCGYKRVGYFSGQRIRRPMPPTPPVLSESFSIIPNERSSGITESKKAKRILAILEQEEESLTLQPKTVLQDEEAQSPHEPEADGADFRGSSNSPSKTAAMMEYRDNVKAWQQKVKRAEMVQRRIRIVVIFCCLAVIVNAILMLIYGVGAIKNSMNQVHSGLDQTSSLATSAINVVDEFLIAQNDAVNVTENVMMNVNTICPTVHATLCQDILQQDNCNLTGIPFQDEIAQVIQVVDEILIPLTQNVSNAKICDDYFKNQATTAAAAANSAINQVAGTMSTTTAGDDAVPAAGVRHLVDETATVDSANITMTDAAAAAAAAEAAVNATDSTMAVDDAVNAAADAPVDLDTLLEQAAANVDKEEASNLVNQTISGGVGVPEAGDDIDLDVLCNEAVNQVSNNSNFNQVGDSLHQAQDALHQIDNAMNQVDEVLDTVKYELFQALNGAKSELQKVVVESEEINQQVSSFDWAFDVAAAFAICLAILSVFIIIGVVLAWRNELNGSCFSWIRNLIIVPVFVILVMLSLIFCCIFVIGSITTSDVCYQSPDSVVLHALETNLYPDLIKSNKEFGPILAKFITFYVQGCPEDVVPLDIDEMLRTKLNYVNNVVTPLQNVLASEEFTDICGSNNGLTNGMQVMLEIMCVVSLLVLDVRDLLNCNNGNSVYTTFAYEAVCYDATKGFVWICSTQLAIVFFSMLIMTLRVACFEIEDEEDFIKQRKWCARLCCCGSSKDKENDDNDDEGGRRDANNEDHCGAIGYKNGPIITLDSDGDAALDSKSGEEPVREEEEHEEPPRVEKRLEPTTEAKIY